MCRDSQKSTLLQKLQTQLQPVDCGISCVCLAGDYQQLGDIDLLNGNWKSACVNKQSKSINVMLDLIECEHHDP